jgi:hypothetical protein
LVVNTYNGSAPPSDGISGSSTGFYIQPYPGSSLSSVILWITGPSASVTLSASDTTTNSPAAIGTVSTGYVQNGTYSPVTFTFNGNPGVTKGDKICFILSSSATANADGLCPQGSTAGNVNIIATTGSTCSANSGYSGPAIALFGNE